VTAMVGVGAVVLVGRMKRLARVSDSNPATPEGQWAVRTVGGPEAPMIDSEADVEQGTRTGAGGRVSYRTGTHSFDGFRRITVTNSDNQVHVG